MTPTIPLLGRALLGLLMETPLSGYDIRRIFTQTPLATFSDSPGAIYPALKRLEAAGLVRGRVERSAGLPRDARRSVGVRDLVEHAGDARRGGPRHRRTDAAL